MATAAIRGRRTAAIALLLVVAFLAQGVRASNASAATLQRDTMLSLTNEDRSAHDRAPLALDRQLSRYAKQHSRDMAKTGYLFHTPDLAAKLKGLDWSLGGENVGVGPSLNGLESAFMHSPEHRGNILQKAYDLSAVGVFHDADGNYWVTIIFYG